MVCFPHPENTIWKNGVGGGRLPQSQEARLKHPSEVQPIHSILRLSGSCEGPKSFRGSRGPGEGGAESAPVSGSRTAAGSWGVEDPSRHQSFFSKQLQVSAARQILCLKPGTAALPFHRWPSWTGDSLRQSRGPPRRVPRTAPLTVLTLMPCCWVVRVSLDSSRSKTSQ